MNKIVSRKLKNFDMFGRSNFLTIDGNYSFKTLPMSLACLLFICYFLGNLSFQFKEFINKPKIIRTSYEKNPNDLEPELTKLLLSDFPLFFQFFAKDKYDKNYRDIDQILVHKVSFSKNKNVTIELKKCTEKSYLLYNEKFLSNINQIKEAKNMYCLYFDKAVELNFNDSLIIKSDYCIKNELNNCFAKSELESLNIKIKVVINYFKFDPETYRLNPEEITPIYDTLDETINNKIYNELSISSYYIRSLEGFFKLEPKRFNLPRSQIKDTKFGRSKFEFTIKRTKESEIFVRIYESIFDVLSRVGGLLSLLKYAGIFVKNIYKDLFVSKIYNEFIFSNEKILDKPFEIIPKYIISNKSNNIPHNNYNKNNQFNTSTPLIRYKKANFFKFSCYNYLKICVCFKSCNNRRKSLHSISKFIKEVLSVRYLFFTIIVNYEKIKDILNNNKKENLSIITDINNTHQSSFSNEFINDESGFSIKSEEKIN